MVALKSVPKILNQKRRTYISSLIYSIGYIIWKDDFLLGYKDDLLLLVLATVSGFSLISCLQDKQEDYIWDDEEEETR